MHIACWASPSPLPPPLPWGDVSCSFIASRLLSQRCSILTGPLACAGEGKGRASRPVAERRSASARSLHQAVETDLLVKLPGD